MKKQTYAGSIKNQGSQVVKSIFDTGNTVKKATVKKGKDLRSGK